MSYNFDPDRWYENELSIVQSKYLADEITHNERDRAIDDLDQKYREMWDRLDGSYQIPKP
jgi:hypothetical protein